MTELGPESSEKPHNAERKNAMEELGNIYDQLQDPEFLKQTATQRLKEKVCPAIKYLFKPENEFGFEQIIRVDAPHPFHPFLVDSASV